jgi:hypothetical protein
MGEALAQEIRGVAGLSDDLETGLGKEARNSFAQEDVVLADYQSQGR